MLQLINHIFTEPRDQKAQVEGALREIHHAELLEAVAAELDIKVEDIINFDLAIMEHQVCVCVCVSGGISKV